MDFIYRYISPLGGITLASGGEKLAGLWFDGQKHFASVLSKERGEADLPVFRLAQKWLDMYFSGERPDFTPPLELRGTPFMISVWKELIEIPYGATRTYGEIARDLATSARAVGSAVGRNPISLIVPCHRVIGFDGSLTGYAGGMDRKRWLLGLEGAV